MTSREKLNEINTMIESITTLKKFKNMDLPNDSVDEIDHIILSFSDIINAFIYYDNDIELQNDIKSMNIRLGKFISSF